MKTNNFPIYNINLPSGKSVSFRPFIVKEENAILIAKESQNNKNILSTIIEVMNACFSDNTNEYSISDFEYAFLNLRGKSIGEIENAKIKCPETNQEVSVSIDCIKDIKILENKQDNIIQLYNKKIKLKQLTIKDILKNPEYNTSFENKLKLIADNIVHVQYD